MQRLEVSCAVRPIYWSLGAKGLKYHVFVYTNLLLVGFECKQCLFENTEFITCSEFGSSEFYAT
jgi:hypothetical protein